jgi:hypothetical protein
MPVAVRTTVELSVDRTGIEPVFRRCERRVFPVGRTTRNYSFQNFFTFSSLSVIRGSTSGGPKLWSRMRWRPASTCSRASSSLSLFLQSAGVVHGQSPNSLPPMQVSLQYNAYSQLNIIVRAVGFAPTIFGVSSRYSAAELRALSF